MKASQITFQPFVSVNGTYDTGLAGVTLSDKGELGSDSSPGVVVNWGVTGSHNWRRSRVGLTYRGGISHYFQQTYFNSINQALLFGVSHQLSRHITLDLNESAGTFSRDFGRLGLDPSVPFDPATTHTPTTDYFDNRTYYVSSQANLSIQKSARTSFNLGGDVFLNRRRSTALYGTTGVSARGDVQYRWSRRITIGGLYDFSHFTFTRIFGGTYVHSVAGTFAVGISAKTEFTGYVGVARAESEFVQSVPLDPVIVALLGITSGTRVVGQILYAPNVNARLSRTVSKGVIFVGGGHGFTPGNGLFLTSVQTSVLAGYHYTGLRRWSLGGDVSYNRDSGVSIIEGKYQTTSGSVSLSRHILPSVHLTMSYAARRYSSATFDRYNRTIHQAQIGLAFAPKDVPLRIW